MVKSWNKGGSSGIMSTLPWTKVSITDVIWPNVTKKYAYPTMETKDLKRTSRPNSLRGSQYRKPTMKISKSTSERLK